LLSSITSVMSLLSWPQWSWQR